MVNEKDIKMAAHSIYFKNADKPKETVIARVKLTKNVSAIREIENALSEWIKNSYKEGKTIEIIIREVTDE